MNIKPPVLPKPPKEYSTSYMDSLLRTLNNFFRQFNAPLVVNAATVNINERSLPTEEDYPNLRSGDVYVDTTQDNALKVKL